MRHRTLLTISVTLNGRTLKLKGRNAWALRELQKAGANGVEPRDNPAPRWSAYVHHLRSQGFSIDTIREKHDGDFPGTHARYVLRSNVVMQGGGHATT